MSENSTGSIQAGSRPRSGSIYIPEIDGLRAVAVGGVILFHFDVGPFPGGFVGVDIFFVISGFLITGIIDREIRANTFTLRDFWLRRARRILPAALVMTLVTIVAFALIFPPAFFRDLADSLRAQAVFASNIHFWREDGYFADSAHLKPLLHTWSLSLEEQFYLAFPLILVVCGTLRTGIRISVVVLIFATSLTICVLATYSAPTASFYLLPYRAWELCAGAVLALLANARRAPLVPSHPVRELLCAGGLVAIALAYLLLDENSPFPSYTAMLPVAGAVAIILANLEGGTFIGSVLRWRLSIGVGLISYSLYLWHWPIYVLLSWTEGWPLGLVPVAGGMLLSLALAVLSYRYVELPVRTNRLRFPPSTIAVGSIAGTAGVFLVAHLLLDLGNGVLVDRNGTLGAWHDEARALEPHADGCLNKLRTSSGEVSCRYEGEPARHVDVFVWGDSQASVLVPAFERAARERELSFDFAVSTGCVPVSGMRRVDRTTPKRCEQINASALAHLIETRPSVVVLAGSYVGALRSGAIRDVRAERRTDADRTADEFFVRLHETVRALHGIGSTVVMVVEPPRPSRHPVLDQLRARMVGASIESAAPTPTEHRRRTQSFYEAVTREMAIEILDLSDEFCGTGRCTLSLDDRSLYRDRAHLSNFGALLLAEPIGAFLTELSQRGAFAQRTEP